MTFPSLFILGRLQDECWSSCSVPAGRSHPTNSTLPPPRRSPHSRRASDVSEYHKPSIRQNSFRNLCEVTKESVWLVFLFWHLLCCWLSHDKDLILINNVKHFSLDFNSKIKKKRKETYKQVFSTWTELNEIPAVVSSSWSDMAPYNFGCLSSSLYASLYSST